MDFSFKDKFCKHFAALRQRFEVFVSFNIYQCLLSKIDKMAILLFHDEKLNFEKEKKVARSICRKV